LHVSGGKLTKDTLERAKKKKCFKQKMFFIFVSEQDVRCVWYGEEGRKTSVFDQRTLTKSTKRHGLFTT
jgi:hypothetical protein